MTSNKRTPKIYTRTGDKGKTSLIGGTRVSKSSPRLDAYGTVDELNSVVGLLICDLAQEFTQPDSEGSSKTGAELVASLTDLQHHLFNVGSQLACEDEKLRATLPGLPETLISELEDQMDQWTTVLRPLKNFILPGGARAAAQAHIARTVCRRAERLCTLLELGLEPKTGPDAENSNDLHNDINQNGDGPGQVATVATVVQFLNRLSDYFFVLARYINHCLHFEEPIWVAKARPV